MSLHGNDVDANSTQLQYLYGGREVKNLHHNDTTLSDTGGKHAFEVKLHKIDDLSKGGMEETVDNHPSSPKITQPLSTANTQHFKARTKKQDLHDSFHEVLLEKTLLHPVIDDLQAAGSNQISVSSYSNRPRITGFASLLSKKPRSEKLVNKRYRERKKMNSNMQKENSNEHPPPPLSFSNMLSQIDFPSHTPSFSNTILATRRPFSKIFQSPNNHRIHVNEEKNTSTESQLVADHAKAIRKEAMQFHREVKKNLEKQKRFKTKQEGTYYTIPPRVRALLERIRVSLIAEKLRHLQEEKEFMLRKNFNLLSSYIKSNYSDSTKKIDRRKLGQMEREISITKGNTNDRKPFLKYTSKANGEYSCLLYTSPSPRDATLSRMPSSA